VEKTGEIRGFLKNNWVFFKNSVEFLKMSDYMFAASLNPMEEK